MYLTFHNACEESQNIRKEYRARLLELDDDRYYQEIDHAYQTYGPLPAWTTYLQRHNQQVLAKPHHKPSDKDQQAREKLQQKAKIKS